MDDVASRDLVQAECVCACALMCLCDDVGVMLSYFRVFPPFFQLSCDCEIGQFTSMSTSSNSMYTPSHPIPSHRNIPSVLGTLLSVCMIVCHRHAV